MGLAAGSSMCLNVLVCACPWKNVHNFVNSNSQGRVAQWYMVSPVYPKLGAQVSKKSLLFCCDFNVFQRICFSAQIPQESGENATI